MANFQKQYGNKPTKDRRNVSECSLDLHEISVQFQVPLLSSSQPPITLATGHLSPLLALMYTYIHLYIQITQAHF